MRGNTSGPSCELCDHAATIIAIDSDDTIDLALCSCCFRALLSLTDEIVTMLAAGILPTPKQLAMLRSAANN